MSISPDSTPDPATEAETGGDPGRAMHAFITQLFPLQRSITGPGVRETLRRIGDLVPLQVHEVPSGTTVLDWTVPREWRIRAAHVEDEHGRKVVDLTDSNLHIEAYSRPIDMQMPWSQLRERVHTLPDRPHWIPYRTSYYDESWGICMTHEQYEVLEAEPDREYRVRIDSELIDGSLTYGEAVLPGETDEEILVWTHVCHPSLANDNLSGIAVATWLARAVAQRDRRHTFRFVFAPATIGAITWLERNRDRLSTIRHGLVLSSLGDEASLNYKRSRRGNATVDRAAVHVLKHIPSPGDDRAFEPFGYDERQFCSPGFNLPLGCLMRSINGTYPEYHTSADDLDFVRPASLAESLSAVVEIVEVLEGNDRYLNSRPHGEPRLGPHGLYEQFEHGRERDAMQRAVLWTLNLSDGDLALLDIAERAEMPFAVVRAAADELLAKGLLVKNRKDL